MGLKKTSDPVAISFSIVEAVVDTFVQEQINLTLDILNQEVFVVLAVDLDAGIPSNVAGLNTQTQMSLTTTSQTGVVLISNTNCIAEERNQIAVDPAVPGNSIFFRQSNGSTPQGNLPYIGIIATNNFFVQLKGNNNLTPRSGTGRVWGYRAKADSSTYSALVASEVLSQ